MMPAFDKEDYDKIRTQDSKLRQEYSKEMIKELKPFITKLAILKSQGYNDEFIKANVMAMCTALITTYSNNVDEALSMTEHIKKTIADTEKKIHEADDILPRTS